MRPSPPRTHAPQALSFVDLPTLMGAQIVPDEGLLALAQVGWGGARAPELQGCTLACRAAAASWLAASQE